MPNSSIKFQWVVAAHLGGPSASRGWTEPLGQSAWKLLLGDGVGCREG